MYVLFQSTTCHQAALVIVIMVALISRYGCVLENVPLIVMINLK